MRTGKSSEFYTIRTQESKGPVELFKVRQVFARTDQTQLLSEWFDPPGFMFTTLRISMTPTLCRTHKQWQLIFAPSALFLMEYLILMHASLSDFIYYSQRSKNVMKMAFEHSDFLFLLYKDLTLLSIQSLLHLKLAQSGSILR